MDMRGQGGLRIFNFPIPELLLWPGRHTWVPPEPSQSGSPLLTTMMSVYSSLSPGELPQSSSI